MMKERFAKLLLGEDMSGGGMEFILLLPFLMSLQIFLLQPLSPQRKLMWRIEMDWLLSVTDFIVELKPSLQEFPGGGTFEVMVHRPRSDLLVNLPALKKLDAMLISILDGFHNSEFDYADRVPPSGLSEDSRKRLQLCRECTHQILKAATAINNNVLAEMEIPIASLKSLPKCEKDYLDLSSEYSALEMANSVEASVHIWKHKYLRRHSLRAKAETLLQNLRLRFPGLCQTSLDTSKIQHNKEVGQSILEGYSRVMESLAFNITARIDDLLYVDDATKKRAAAESITVYEPVRFDVGSL
ncbi:hypothetical protein F3Y22_tig00110646pilonHSYRG00019 [Hibiscus syriacus]|uniref:PRONE domain-containing protein n=1 Tax=Hibiscus syriacus TaxID=106335 RepID=A0A6A2ZYI4_HIBSY|nr:hypothetical protein F3Y22_tig00110646pilonHSYRG00019 [Hibiscus syriacus]